MKKRKQWIDFLRGFVMLLVIWGHIDRIHHPFFLLTGAFKIPLFFAITGYVFNDRKGDVKIFVQKLFSTIIVPWVILSLVWAKVPYYLLLKRKPASAAKVLYRFVSGKDFWFMPCLVVAEIIFFIIRKYIKDVKMQYLAMAAVCIVGVIFSRMGIMRFALADVACTSLGFMLFGYWFRNNEESIKEWFSGARLAIPGAIFVCLAVAEELVFGGRTIDVHMNKYFNYPLAALMIFTAMLFWFLAAERTERYIQAKRNNGGESSESRINTGRRNPALAWVVFVGQNTLVFYILHYIVRKVLTKAYKILLHVKLPKNTMGFLAMMIPLCIILSIASIIINRWFPFVVGKSAPRKQKKD